MAENESLSQTKEKGGDKTKIIVIVVLAVALVIAVAILAVTYFITHKPKEEDNGRTRESITADNAEERVKEIFEKEAPSAPGYYTVTQSPEWRFANGSAESENMYVENVTDNETPVYFDLIVDETGETVYSSPVLELGAKLEKIKLDTPLEKGDYSCTMVYHLVDENQNTLTTVNVGVTVVVEN